MADTGSPDAAPRIPLGWVLTGILVGLAALNTFITWLSSERPLPDHLEIFIIGASVFEPMLFAIWAALGPGRIEIRLPIIVPFLAIVMAIPGLILGTYPDVEQYEFVVLLVAACVAMVVVTLILLALRCFTGWRIQPAADEQSYLGQKLQFDIKYLILLITLYSIAFGITFSLKFAPPGRQNLFFGPGFYVYAFSVGGAFISIVILPVLAVPLLILQRRPSIKFLRSAVAFWLAITVGAGVFLIAFEESEEFEFALLLIQFGAAALGIVVALPLRLAGSRLTNRHAPTSGRLTPPLS
jgi:hypothetical protein